jgi:apolipoprotein N-acyltransferase
MRSELYGRYAQLRSDNTVRVVWLRRPLWVLALAVLCAAPLGLAFAHESSVAPYLSLVAFVPSLYVVRQMVERRQILLFCFATSLAANAMVTYWMPHAVGVIFVSGAFTATLLTLLLWLFWCVSNSVFLLVYRYCQQRHLAWVACMGVVLFNYWPAVFGVNPFTALMHASALSGSASFLGTAGVELLVILLNASLASLLLRISLRLAARAVVIVFAVLALDRGAAWYLASAPATTLNVTLVQAGNVYPQKLSSAQEIELFAQQLVDESRFTPDLIVFPENVFSFNLADDPESGEAAIAALERFSSKQPVAFLISTVKASAQRLPPAGKKKPTHLSALLISGGRQQGFADKAKTIPFAEYTPVWAVAALDWLGRKVETRAPSSGFRAMAVKGVPIIPLSCFESLDQAVVESRLGGAPGLLVNQSNMDDFGIPGSSTYRAALWGHMAHEQRWVNQWQVPLVRAVRGGASASIDAYGRLDGALMEQSWGEEWVSTQVSIPDARPLSGYFALLRQTLSGLIVAMAVLGSVRGVAAWLRSRWMPTRGWR